MHGGGGRREIGQAVSESPELTMSTDTFCACHQPYRRQEKTFSPLSPRLTIYNREAALFMVRVCIFSTRQPGASCPPRAPMLPSHTAEQHRSYPSHQPRWSPYLCSPTEGFIAKIHPQSVESPMAPLRRSSSWRMLTFDPPAVMASESQCPFQAPWQQKRPAFLAALSVDL